MTTQHESGHLTQPPRIQVGNPAELIAAVPYLLGFFPTDSLVAVTTRDRGDGDLVEACGRADLQPAIESTEEALARLAALVGRDGPVDAMFFVYTEDELPPGWERRLSAAAVMFGFRPVGAWQVDGDRYRPLASDPEPWQCLTLAEIGRVAAEFVLQGRAPAASRTQLLPDLSPAPGPVRDAVARVCSATRRPDAGVRQRAVRVWHRALAQQAPLGPARCGLVHAGLRSVLLRDALLASCVGLEEPEVLRAATSTRAAGRLFDQLLTPGSAGPPDPDRIAASSALLAELVRCAPPGGRAEPLSVLAWCAWWTGDGASANQYLDLLFQEDPGHSLGQLLDAALTGGVRPGWVPR